MLSKFGILKMIKTSIIIIGGGLSGLYAAYLLEQAGFKDYLLLEAKHHLGGRIQSKDEIDLGAIWIWPDLNPELMKLVHKLNLPYFYQQSSGEIMFEKQRNQPAIRVSSGSLETPSIRLEGGMESLILALTKGISVDRILFGHQVKEITYLDDRTLSVKVKDHLGTETRFGCNQLLLATPPRLSANQFIFDPPLSTTTLKHWTNTPTWMAPHAKYVAVYSEAFWKQQGLSGQARSYAGPLGEIHDASTSSKHAALFGFFSIPYSIRKEMEPTTLIAHCRAQLVRLFGSLAAIPQSEYLKDWSEDECTAVESDWKDPALFHGIAPENTPNQCIWQHRIIGISSEWSKKYSGYLAGAIDAAEIGVEQILNNVKYKKISEI